MGHTELHMRERIETIRGQISLDPGNVSLYQNLAELHTRLGELDDAEVALRKGLELSGGDFTFHVAIADLHIRRMLEAIHEVEAQQAAAPDDATLQAQLKKMQRELNTFELREYRERRERYPTDLDVRYELAVRLYKAGKFDDAIAEFQAARRNPKRRFSSLDYLGRAFARQGNYDVALAQFREALTVMAVGDDDAEKHLRYNLMVVAEKAGDQETYNENLKRLAALDYSYRDVSQRLRKQQGAAPPADA